MQTQRGSAGHQNSIVISPDGFRLVKLRQDDTTGGNKKLGFSLRGGREATGSSVGVFVSHVELAGQASKNGLKVGDQLIQVNGLQVSQATYEEVIELIRRTPKCDEICLLVKYVGKIPFQERTGQPIRWLQIELAEADGVDTTTLAANPRVDTDEPHLLLLNDLDGNERLKVSPNGGGARRKHASNYQDDSAASSQSLTFTSGASSSCSGASIKDEDDEEEEAEITLLHVVGGTAEEEEACQLVSSAASSSSGCSVSMSSVQSGSSTSVELTRDGATPVRVPGGRRTSEPFGCGVVKGPDEWPGIFVQNVKPASLAARVGLEPGDQLVRADDQELAQLPFEQAIALIKSLQQQQDELLLLVRKGAALRHLAACKSHHDLKSREPASATQQAAVQPTTAWRRKPLEPPPAPPSRQQQQVAAESVSCAQQQQQQQQQQQVGQTKPFKGDSQAAAAASQRRQGQRQKQADSSIRLDGGAGAASGPTGEQQPRQRRQTTTPTGNAKSQQESAAVDCTTNANADERQQLARRHAKPEDKNKRAPGCTKTIRAPLASSPPPPRLRMPADRLDAENLVQTQECSAERECQCDTGRAPSSSPPPPPPEDHLPSTSSGARQQRAPTARRPALTSPLVAQSDGQQRQRTQQVAASDNDGATPSSSPPLVVNQMLHTHQSPRSMKLNYDSGEEEEEEEEGNANQHDESVSQSHGGGNNLCCHRSGATNDETSNANEQRTGAGKTRAAPAAARNQGSQARSVQENGETMRLAAWPQDAKDAQDERELREEIKIVKQNCKLHHHNSMHSLVNSRLFHTANDLKQRGAPGAVEAAKVIKSKTQRAPPPPPPARSLQRYVSMDNLSGPQQKQLQHNHLLMLQQQQQQQQQLNGHKRLGCQTSRQRNAAPQPLVTSDSRPSPFYRRSNSVLGQPVSSCCALTQHHHRLLLRDHQGAQLLRNPRASVCNCLDCQQQVVVTSKTMRYAPRAGPPPVGRPCSVTLSKFKARSEDKLNLMQMNLNYAPKQQQVASGCTGGSAQLARLQQARLAAGEHQARQSALVSKRHHDSAAQWLTHHQQQRAPVTTSGCCAVSSSAAGLLRPVACHMDAARGAPSPRLVFNYATATGVIATGRGGMSSAASCCAINELAGEHLARARKPHRTRELLLLEQRLIMQQQQRHPATCCSCCCSSSSSSPSSGPSMRTPKSAAPSSQTAFRACKSAQPSGGASTDSSGYQSTSGGERPPGRPPAGPPTPGQQRDMRTRLSTFNPQPCGAKKAAVAPAAPRSVAKLSSTPSIEISSCGSSGSLGSATCSPGSSSNSSSCSPLSSPRYLSSTSSCGSTPRAAGHYEVSQARGKLTEEGVDSSIGSPRKPKLLRGKLLGGSALATPTREHIPCPPPMPLLDDNSQTLRAPTAAAAPSHHKRQEPGRLPTSGESAQTELVAGKPTGGGARSNKLCFVDELKMLASQQAATESTNSGGASGNKGAKSRGVQQPGESETLIKIINANKQTVAQQQTATPRSHKCSCCPAATGSECSPRVQCNCNLSATATSKSKCCYPSAGGKSAAGGCHRGRPPASKPDGASAASKLRDEEYTRRRQHELLMEEFKTAHSKMFNKLRQKRMDESQNEQQQQQEIAGDVYDDDLDEDGRAAAEASAQSTAHHDMGQQQQQQKRSSAATAAGGNLIIRPRTTVATN